MSTALNVSSSKFHKISYFYPTAFSIVNYVKPSTYKLSICKDRISLGYSLQYILEQNHFFYLSKITFLKEHIKYSLFLANGLKENESMLNNLYVLRM